MNVLRPQRRKRLELALTFLIGLLWGFGVSQLLQRTKWQIFTSNEQEMDNALDIYMAMSSSGIGCGSNINNRQQSTNLLPMAATDVANNSVSLAERLFKETRVLCIVITMPKRHKSMAQHIQQTWGKRCNKLIFMSSESDPQLGIVSLPVREGYSNLWNKTRESLHYVYEHHYEDYDWFLKTDDDTYIIMENLRAMLYAYTPRAPVYFGSKFRRYVKQGYMSGGAGYVLSKEALRRFMKLGYTNSSICSSKPYGAEDMELGRCLQNVGVIAGDSRDKQGMARFFPFSPLRHFKKPPDWYTSYMFYKLPTNQEGCCSDSAISFHYTNSLEFYVFEYFIYKVRPFGLHTQPDRLPTKLRALETLQKWRDAKPDSFKKIVKA